MTKTQQKQIDEIARRVLRIETLAEQKSDELDFHELAVWTIERALNAAYEAGRRDATTKTN